MCTDVDPPPGLRGWRRLLHGWGTEPELEGRFEEGGKGARRVADSRAVSRGKHRVGTEVFSRPCVAEEGERRIPTGS